MYLIDTRHTFLDWPEPDAVYGALLLFFAGCDNQCKGCHNVGFKEHRKQRHSIADIKKIIKERGKGMPRKRYEYLIFSGGDPFSSQNFPEVIELIDKLQDYNTMVYTGMEAEDLRIVSTPGIDYYKCGKFVKKYQQQSGHRDGAFYLASTNQTLLNYNKSIVSVNGVYRYCNEER
jgi:organic radical activating enzyme